MLPAMGSEAVDILVGMASFVGVVLLVASLEPLWNRENRAASRGGKSKERGRRK